MKFVACIREYSLRSYVLALTAGFLISSCGGSDGPPPVPPSISVSSTSLDADVSGEDVSVDVSNGGEGTLSWTASIPSSVDWARISSGSSGTNAGTIQIEVDANTGAAREFELTVSASGTASSTVTVSQAEAPPVIDVSAVSTDLEGDGGSVTLQVSNSGYGAMEWTASLPEDVEWAHIESGEAGTDSGEIVVRYDLNGGVDRELEVTVTASAASNSPQALTLEQDWFATGACTYSQARQVVFDRMEVYYYFNDEPEQQAKYGDLEMEDYGSLDAMLDELRWMPETRDRGFTYWLTQKQTDMIFNATAYIFGFRVIYIVNAAEQPVHLEITDVYRGSPAENAGFQRSDKIISLNEKAIEGMSFDQVSAEFGPNEDGYEVTFEIEKSSGARDTYVVAKGLVETPTVPQEHVRVFDTTAGKVGYFHFRTFFGDAPERLLDEFADFNSQGVRHLIVDLRYNGGGFVWIAELLATLIGGPELFENELQTVMARQRYNSLIEKEGGSGRTSYFGCDRFDDVLSNSLRTKCRSESPLRGLEKVVFITGRGSASASELVIVSLQPYESVELVGDRTYGKPVGQFPFPFCREFPGDQNSNKAVLWPVTFSTENAVGFDDYYDGIPVAPACEVPDDRSHQLGDREEGRIAAALRLIETGSCQAPASARVSRAAAEMQASPPVDPIKQFLGY